MIKVLAEDAGPSLRLLRSRVWLRLPVLTKSFKSTPYSNYLTVTETIMVALEAGCTRASLMSQNTVFSERVTITSTVRGKKPATEARMVRTKRFT